jgi:hypothetical protein
MAKPICEDGTVIVKKEKKSPCANGEKPVCPDGSAKVRGSRCADNEKPVCEDGTVFQKRSRGGRGGGKGRKLQRFSRGPKSKASKKSKGRKSMHKKMMKKFAKIKYMMRRRKGIFGLLDANSNMRISHKEMFKPFAKMDSDKNLSVSEAEFNTYMDRAKRPVCMYLKRAAWKRHNMSWIQKGSGIGSKGLI